MGVLIEAIIPTKDAPAERLRRAVESARAVADRVVIVDDGSAEEVVVEHADVVRRPTSGGPSAARNIGLSVSRGEWVVFLDDDDALIAEGVRAAVDLAEPLNAAAVVSARVEVREGTDGHAERVREAPTEWAGGTLASPGLVFTPIGLFGASGLVVRGEVARQDRFDEALWIGEDRDYLRRLGGAGPIAVNATPAVRVTLRDDGNLTSAAHLERRVADHVTLLERWWGEESAAGLGAGTRWLLSACAKGGVSAAAWSALVSAARERGIGVGIKTRLRRMRIGARP